MTDAPRTLQGQLPKVLTAPVAPADDLPPVRITWCTSKPRVLVYLPDVVYDWLVNRWAFPDGQPHLQVRMQDGCFVLIVSGEGSSLVKAHPKHPNWMASFSPKKWGLPILPPTTSVLAIPIPGLGGASLLLDVSKHLDAVVVAAPAAGRHEHLRLLREAKAELEKRVANARKDGVEVVFTLELHVVRRTEL